MYLKKSTRKKTSRVYLSIVHGYWDAERKISKTKTIESLGYLDELIKEYDDPIAHFEKVVEQMNEKYKNNNSIETINIDLNEKLEKNNSNRKNFGYAAFSKIYHELKIDDFLISRQKGLNVEYNINNIMKLLIFSRLINPSSKKRAYENKDMFFENCKFSLIDMYRALTIFNKFKNDIQLHIYKQIKEQYKPKNDVVYYDVTNYYFEINEQDELRRKGVCKEHKPKPIVQMGLLMDTNGIPITYKLFKGNTNDCTTLLPVLKDVRKAYNLGRVIVVADKGLNTAENIYYNIKRNNGYVFSQSVRKANKELKDFVLKDDGYTWIGSDFKIKSRLYPREIEVIENDEKVKKKIDEKQVIFYSKDYDKRAKAEREATIIKARDFVNKPSKYKNAISYGATKYIKNLKIDKKTGEIKEDYSLIEFDEKKLREEEKLDGYYAIITSEFKESDEKIIEIYRGLWKIEESFKITKSDLEARPVYVSRQDRIEAHFLTCFISLVLSRIVQHRLSNEYCVTRILESLRKISCSHNKENIYLFDYRDDLTDAIGNCLGIDFTRKNMKLGEIKKILAEVKKD